MRIACLLLAALASFSSGCAAFIASRGKDLTVLTTKEEVHAVLGEPAASGVDEGQVFEEFRTRQKIATFSWVFGEGYLMLMVGTGGTAELVLTPMELYRVCKGTLLGQTIRVTYDTAGRATGHYLNGESLPPSQLFRTLPPVEQGQIPPAPLPPLPTNPGR